MSEQNKALVNGLYDAFARGDVPGVLAGFADDIEWVEPEGLPYESQNSAQGVAENVFGRVTSDIDGFSVTPNQLVAEGDTVVAFITYGGTGHETGKELDLEAAHVWTVRDGKCIRFRELSDTRVFADVIGAAATV
jgi:uncharacterized protein